MLWRNAILVSILAVALAGCGFQPLYGSGGAPGSTVTELATIKIYPISDRIGQQLRNALRDKLTPRGAPRASRYGLTVNTNVGVTESSIRKDEIATRANLELGLHMTLTDTANGEELLVRSLQYRNSFNILRAQYANIAAQRDAEERLIVIASEDIRNRLALFFQNRAGAE